MASENLAQNMNSQESVLQTLCNCSVSMFDERIFARERSPTLSNYTLRWTLQAALFVWCFIFIRLWSAINTLELHCFGGSWNFNLISMCAVMSQASRLHASIALVMFLQHDWCYLGLQVEKFTIRVMFTDWNPRNCLGPLICFLLLIVTNLRNIHLKQMLWHNYVSYQVE